MDKLKAYPELAQNVPTEIEKESTPVREERKEDVIPTQQESLSSKDFIDLGFDVRRTSGILFETFF